MRYPSRRSKIVCTIGPAVASPEKLRSLIEKGMDVARLNFSHGTHEAHKQSIIWIREASKSLGVPVAILADLQGPKIRTGKIKGGFVDSTGKLALALKPGMPIYFVGADIMNPLTGEGTEASPLSISYLRLGLDLKVNDEVLFDDGLAKMKVKKTFPEKNTVLCEVMYGNTLGENKGVNFPGATLSTLGVTEKDWDDILFVANEDVDFFALSFVRSSREIRHLKDFIKKRKLQIGVIAKIEKNEAIDNIDDILEYSDGIMVARGDLGLEIGNENVAIAQKKLIKRAREYGKPVITATQMLMSMVDNPSPSRAEASDITNAVLDGTDALMLSNETATGKYPLEAVETMANIIKGAEGLSARDFGDRSLKALTDRRLPVSEAIEAAATILAASLNAKCLACLTRSGQAARLLAKYRPGAPIYAFAENERVRNQLSLSWGVSVIAWEELASLGYTVFDDLVNALGSMGLMQDGDLAVMTAGIPTSMQVGTTNTVVVRTYPTPPTSRL